MILNINIKVVKSCYNLIFIDFLRLSKPPTGRGFSQTGAHKFGCNHLNLYLMKTFLNVKSSVLNAFAL